MFTSGSSGEPKGVAVPWRAIGRLVDQPDMFRLSAGDVVAFASNPAFDAATFEIWSALTGAAVLQVVDHDTMLDPAALAAAISRWRVSVLFVTTALFNAVARARPDAFGGCGTVLFGGEAVNPIAVKRVLAAGPPGRLVHAYGPTEGTTFTTWQIVDRVDAGESGTTIPIGYALSGTTVELAPPAVGPQPGVSASVPAQGPTARGELVIGGARRGARVHHRVGTRGPRVGGRRPLRVA